MAIDISSEAISLTGADGAIVYMFGDEDKDTAFSFAVPVVIVLEKEFNHIVDYYNSTRSAAAACRRAGMAATSHALLCFDFYLAALTCYLFAAAATPW